MLNKCPIVKISPLFSRRDDVVSFSRVSRGSIAGRPQPNPATKKYDC